MRYLYGDSAPFPHGFDFLSTLERFLEEGARIVKLDTEMRELAELATAGDHERTRALAELETFHADVVRMVEQGGLRVGGEFAPDYAGRVLESATRGMEEARRAVALRAERDEQTLARELGRRHDDVQRALEAFFLRARLPILAATFRMGLDGATTKMQAELVHEGAIIASLALAVDRVPEWQHPRKAGDFVTPLELLVGLKRAGLFRRGETLEPVRLDEYVIGGFVLKEDTAEIRLRRRANEPDSYVFDARLVEGRLVVEVARPLEPSERAMPIPLEEGDRRLVLSLWERLRNALEGPLDRRERLVGLVLDGDDVFEQGLYLPLLERLVRSFSHTIAEVARRSPNKEELSLKREADGGMREELYLKKRDLVARLEGLSPEELALFSPLNLTPPSALASAR